MLRNLSNEASTVRMYDVLEDEICISFVLSKLGKVSLNDVVRSFPKNCPAELAHSTIAKLVEIVLKVHAC